MTETKTLRETLEGRDVFYRLRRVGVQTIKQPKRVHKQMADGTFEAENIKGIYLSRMGNGRSTELSHPYDPVEHADIIAMFDDWIAKNPRLAAQAGIEKLGEDRPAERIDNWDNMTIDQIEVVVEAMKPDLVWCMEYELKRPENLGGLREDVIELLEVLHANGFQSEIEQSEEAPVL